MARKELVLTDEEKALRKMVCNNKKELIDSKEFFEVGVNGTVIKARVAGAGESSMKFAWFLGGISKKAKATQQTFFLDWNELDDGLVSALQAFCGETTAEEVEEIADENIVLFGQSVPAK